MYTCMYIYLYIYRERDIYMSHNTNQLFVKKKVLPAFAQPPSDGLQGEALV